MNRSFVAVVLLAFLAQLSVQRGTIYLNEIQSIPDPISGVAQIPIECTLWVENEIYLDTLQGIPAPGTGDGHGVDIDGVLTHNGTWVFPSTFDVAGHVTVGGLIQPDGGWFADDGDVGDADGDGNDWSFSVEDNTGNTWVAGTLDIALGLNNQDDISTPFSTFDVTSTGETTIEGILYPNGGINILDGVITVDDDGIIFASGDLEVEGDLYYGRDGDPATLAAFSVYFPPDSLEGGDLILQGQDATDLGGDIVFVPGLPTGVSIHNLPGRVIIGKRNQNYDLYLTRAVNDAEEDAGTLYVTGQTSNRSGGDLQMQAGNAEGPGNGGDIILDPGFGLGHYGNIVLGDPNDGPNVPYIITRPDVLESEHAGDTEFRAQDTAGSFRAGDLYIVAGDGTVGGGDMHLVPGSNGPTTGDIILGNLNQNRPENILLSRLADPDATDASDTYFVAQHSTGSSGGDLWFVGGDGSDTNGGSIFLSPGRREDGVIGGKIIWGTVEEDLNVYRPFAFANGRSTTISGQSSTRFEYPGGDIFFFAGDGVAGGDLNLLAGDGEHGDGGSVYLAHGFAESNVQGDIQISSGDGFPAGDVFIFAGNSGIQSAGTTQFFGRGGNVLIDAGLSLSVGGSNGVVRFTNAGSLILFGQPLILDARTVTNARINIFDPSVVAQTTRLSLFPSASANGFLLYSDALNVFPMFQPRITLPSTIYSTINPYDFAGANLGPAIQQLYTNFGIVLAALRSHGLVL